MKIVTAAIARQGERVLLTRRAPGEKLAGWWEFPGGKQEPGETLQECLQRELLEELGVGSTVKEVMVESEYHYEHGSIKLVALHTTLLSDRFTLSVHDRAEWVLVSDLLTYQLAPADIPIAQHIQRT